MAVIGSDVEVGFEIAREGRGRMGWGRVWYVTIL
jgi:hypothetical protein